MHDDWTTGPHTFNPPGDRLGVDDLELHRRDIGGPVSATDYLRESWGYVRENLLETIGGLLLAYGLMMGVQMLLTGFVYATVLGGVFAGAALESVDETLATVVAVGGVSIGYAAMIIASVVVQALAFACYQLFWLRLIRGQSMAFSDLRAIKPLILPLLGVTVLSGVAINAGFIALIVPGIVLGLGFALSTWLVIDKNLRTIDAMKASWRLMQGHKMELFVLGLLICLINVGGMMACGMGMILTLPLSAGALTIFYDRIAAPGNAYMHL